MEWTTEIPQREGHYYAKSAFKDSPVFPAYCHKDEDGSFVMLRAGSVCSLRTHFEMSDGLTVPALLIGDCMDEHLASMR